MLIKFIQHSTIYMPGETAEFPDNVAQILIARKAAIPVGDEIRPAPKDQTPEASVVPPTPPTSANKPDRARKPKQASDSGQQDSAAPSQN